MSPVAMLSILVGALAMFAWSASRRWQLIKSARRGPAVDIDDPAELRERLAGTWRFALRQERMDYYNPAGWAHRLIFLGFGVLLLRTLILWGRGFSSGFNLFVLDPDKPLGQGYEFFKDVVAALVIVGALVFVYYRVIRPQKRMTLSGEGLLILCIIITMMLADMTYDGAMLVLAAKKSAICAGVEDVVVASGPCASAREITAPLGAAVPSLHWEWHAPAGSLFAMMLKGASPTVLIVLAHVGFWAHSTLVLVFLNLLPHSKHFHVITAIPNVFLRRLEPVGRLRPLAPNAEQLMELAGAAAEAEDPRALPIGAARIEHFDWKAILDFYTCTECGRCSDNCPAHRTGKVLSPKQLTLSLRNHFYGREAEMLELSRPAEGEKPQPKPVNIEEYVHPDVVWACTTCRACEEQCPVLISYVDKIVDIRRNLVMIKGEFPHELAKPFQAMEVNGNPWNLSRMDRAAWSDGLGIKTFAEHPTAEVLYWVGCAASYDDRAKKIARATAKLLQAAGIDFAILGQEESCTGDPARRAGNELLFAMLAEGNAATLNGYKEQGGMKTVLTACPHCFNTLKNEYPDFGCNLEVVHHTDFLMGLVAAKRLVPKQPVKGRVVYHDSCYLGRYNNVYQAPREILRSIPGVELVEPEYWTKQRGLCCGAGGAQMWMEEQNQDRVNVKRTLQLLDTHPKTIASACPFCMTMLTDGLKSKSMEDQVAQLDVAELLEKSCIVEDAPRADAAPVTPAEAPSEVASV